MTIFVFIFQSLSTTWMGSDPRVASFESNLKSRDFLAFRKSKIPFTKRETDLVFEGAVSLTRLPKKLPTKPLYFDHGNQHLSLGANWWLK